MLILALAAILSNPEISSRPAPLPPQQYTRNTETVIKTVDNPNDGKYCPTAKEGWVTRACTNIDIFGIPTRVIMPNPCFYPNDAYARLLCHELGHANGWPGDHPGKIEYKK